MADDDGAHPEEAEFHVWASPPVEDLWAAESPPWREHVRGRVLDVGSGEGNLLATLRRHGFDAEGVDLTDALAETARRRGLRVTTEDALSFIRRRGAEFDTFFMLDFVEHIPFPMLNALLAAIPRGATIIVQTPNTNSIIGHSFYMAVPSHVHPLSPTVLRSLGERHGFTWRAEGTHYGGLAWRGLRRRITEFALVKIFGMVTTRLLVEGAEYWFVAVKS